jgi:hypothetical protein
VGIPAGQRYGEALKPSLFLIRFKQPSDTCISCRVGVGGLGTLQDAEGKNGCLVTFSNLSDINLINQF